MKNNKGITMVSLVIYVAVTTIALTIMGVIMAMFHKNTDTMQGNVGQILEFNKFNTCFLKEIKTTNNEVDKISNNYILFKSGNSFSISNNQIYYNNLMICDNVENMQILLGKDGDGVDKTIVNVTIDFGNFNKEINYKIENIY